MVDEYHRTIGVIFLGQTPRPEIISFLEGRLSKGRVLSRGALDELELDKIRVLEQSKEYPLFVRLRDGGVTEIALQNLMPYIEVCAKKLRKDGAGLLLLWCCGSFSNLTIDSPVICPGEIVSALLKSFRIHKKIDILVPNYSQCSFAKMSWKNRGFDANVIAANPLINEEIRKRVEEFVPNNSELLVLDCMSFTHAHVEMLRDIYSKPIICPQTMVASIIPEIL